MSGQRWRETQHALCGIAKKAMDYKVNGVEIQFLNSKLQRVGVKVASRQSLILPQVIVL